MNAIETDSEDDFDLNVFSSNLAIQRRRNHDASISLTTGGKSLNIPASLRQRIPVPKRVNEHTKCRF